MSLATEKTTITERSNPSPMAPLQRRELLGKGGLSAAAPQGSSSTQQQPIKKIALEEHFSIQALLPTEKEVSFFAPEVLAAIEPRLPELGEARLKAMDAAGIDIAVLSQTAPGIQGISSPTDASALAIEANNALHSAIAAHPTRFKGFAALNVQTIDDACDELKRCILELGFVGALVNGSTQGIYLDEPSMAPLWSCLEDLDVPLYLHPGIPTDQPSSMVKELDGATWGWSFDTATHALRLIVKGVFEKHPGAKVILGHMGENLPFYLWRLDSRFATTRYRNRISMSPGDCFRKHFWITTSGVCDNAALQCSIESLGVNHVMFSTDYPYEDIELAGRWIEKAPVSNAIKKKVCRDNARNLLRLI